MTVSRFDAHQGDTVRLRVLFQRNGTAFDPDQITKIEIRKRTGATDSDLIVTLDAGDVVQEAQGIFYIDWGIPIDQEIGSYIDRWYVIRDSGDPEEFDDGTFGIFAQDVSAPSGLISVGEVRADYLIDSPLADTQIQDLIDQAGELAYMYTGRTFGADTRTIYVDGTGEMWLPLPFPALEIDSITASLIGGSSEVLDPDDFVIKGPWLVSKEFVPWPRDMRMEGCFLCGGCASGGVFPFGHRNIALTGRFGLYGTVPKLIKRMAGLWCKYAGADGTPSSPAAGNYDGESTELHSYNRRASDTLASVKLRGATGIYEIDHILNLYRGTTIRMAVI